MLTPRGKGMSSISEPSAVQINGSHAHSEDTRVVLQVEAALRGAESLYCPRRLMVSCESGAQALLFQCADLSGKHPIHRLVSAQPPRGVPLQHRDARVRSVSGCAPGLGVLRRPRVAGAAPPVGVRTRSCQARMVPPAPSPERAV